MISKINSELPNENHTHLQPNIQMKKKKKKTNHNLRCIVCCAVSNRETGQEFSARKYHLSVLALDQQIYIQRRSPKCSEMW